MPGYRPRGLEGKGFQCRAREAALLPPATACGTLRGTSGDPFPFRERSSGLRSLAAVLQLSLEDVLDRGVLQRDLGVHALQGRVLALELLDALQLGDRRPGVPRAPQEISRPTDAVATQQVRHRDPRLTFLQDRDDLPPRTATSASSLPDQLTAGEHNNREPFSVALRGRTPIERLGDFQIAA